PGGAIAAEQDAHITPIGAARCALKGQVAINGADRRVVIDDQDAEIGVDTVGAARALNPDLPAAGGRDGRAALDDHAILKTARTGPGAGDAGAPTPRGLHGGAAFNQAAPVVFVGAAAAAAGQGDVAATGVQGGAVDVEADDIARRRARRIGRQG